ncbi:MAG TPA: diguanylate cyclase [Xanthomonadaceae bacterium]
MAKTAPSGQRMRDTIVLAIATGLVVALSAWLSIRYTRQPGTLSTLWIASGVLTGILLTSPREAWKILLVAALAGNIAARALFGDPLYSILGLSFANTLEAALVAWALATRVGNVTDPARIKHVAQVAFASAILACSLSGAIAAALRVGHRAADFLPTFEDWLASHALGMVIFATMTVAARAQGWRLLGRRGHRLELWATVALTGLTTYAIFKGARYPLPFLIFVPLLLGTFRHRFSGAVLGVSVVTAIALSETLAGHGPLYLIPGIGQGERILLLQVFIASTCMLTLPVAVSLTESGFLARRLRESERRYRMLADNSRDLVVCLAADGKRRYISPAAQEMFGWEMHEFGEERWDLVHPDDLGPMRQAFAALRANGGSTTLMFRVRHKDGRYVSVEALAKLVSGSGDAQEIVYSGRDVTQRLQIEQELRHNQRRLIAITDNIPAFVLHVDTDERYTFANAPTSRTMGFDPHEIIGMTVRELVGEENYAEIKPRIDAALRGNTESFEIEREFNGEHFHYQSTYVPDIDADGRVTGFYVMSSDISQLKHTEQELSLLARYDALTGLANRFHFNEALELALARHRRYGRPFALLYLDIDRFKGINDTLGHAVGDGVLIEFAARLRSCLRVTDFAARLGGDEFVVIVEDVDSPSMPQHVGDKMIDMMSSAMAIEGNDVQATTSIGIAYCLHCACGRDVLLRSADRALYEAKAAGRNAHRTTVIDDALPA